MAYNNEIFKQALSELEERRNANEKIRRERRRELEEKIPQAKLLREELIELLGGCLKSIDNKEEIARLKSKISDNSKQTKKLFAENGYPSNYLNEIYTCEKCKDTGYILSSRCACLESILKKKAIAYSNLNYVMEEQNFDNFDITLYSNIRGESGISPKENMESILKAALLFIENFDNCESSMLFIGSTGVGKTFLSSCIAKELLKLGYQVLYQSANKLMDILEEYKFNRNDSLAYSSGVIDDIYHCDLLIIDDLGTEFQSKFTMPALYELINKRLIGRKKMLITTNLSVGELNDVYTERLISRFLGEFSIYEFIGNDLRIKKMMGDLT